MKRLTLLGGLGGIAFAVFTFVSLALASAPGGPNYTPSDVTGYVASGHRAAVFAAGYLSILAAVGLICLFARLREAIAAAGAWQHSAGIFWGTGLMASIAILLGQGITVSMPIAYALGQDGGFSLSPSVIYAIVEVGDTFVLGAGGILMGLSLIGLFAGARSALPTWLRWLTLVAGILGLVSPVFFPFFALLLWALATGIWLVSSAWRAEETATRSAPARPVETLTVT